MLSRREAIREILRSGRVNTQEELRKRLGKEGFAVTQATLSRDLARLGARRVSLPEGGTSYELDEVDSDGDTARLAELWSLVRSIQHNGALVVLQTAGGAASAVALAIDRAHLPEVLGTLAGDDTIFLAPTLGTPAPRAIKQLEALFGRKVTRS